MRAPTTLTILLNDDPNHLGLRCNALRAHQMALITSVCAPVRTPNEILDYFNIKKDATWEEEQELIATHSWIVRVQCSLFVSLWSRQCQM